MPLVSDVQAGASVRLSSALGHTGWDPGLGPERAFEPPTHRAAARTRPLNRAHSRLTRHERLKTSIGRKAEDARVVTSTGRANEGKWSRGWPSGRWTTKHAEHVGFGGDWRRSDHDRAADDENTGLWAWRRRSQVDIDRMMAAQRDDREYHRRVSEMLGTDWPQRRSADRSELGVSRTVAAGPVTPLGSRATSWELEYEFHTAAARTAELRQTIAEREAQWDGFVAAAPMEPQQALRTYEQQQVLLGALRKEAEWLRNTVRSESVSAQQLQLQLGFDSGFPVDYPGGKSLPGDVGIAWSGAYGQAWAGAAENYSQMATQCTTAGVPWLALVANAGRPANTGVIDAAYA